MMIKYIKKTNNTLIYIYIYIEYMSEMNDK